MITDEDRALAWNCQCDTSIEGNIEIAAGRIAEYREKLQPPPPAEPGGCLSCLHNKGDHCDRGHLFCGERHFDAFEAKPAKPEPRGDALEPGWRVVLRKARDAMSCPMGTRANFLMLEAIREIDALLSRDTPHLQPDGLRDTLKRAEARIMHDYVTIDSEWGHCRKVEEIEDDDAWPDEVYELRNARAALAQADREEGK